jgi:two-component system, chemotaxis family, protein-glutamate methylesterase/glutaminase
LFSPERLRPVPTAVVGASAGGVEALRELVSQLPSSYEGALLVVLHVAPLGTSVLPQILARAGEIEATHAVDGEVVKAGHIYVAPPDRHLRVEDGRLTLDRGPRINGYRPAIDALFRSAADAWGRRAVGVVLSGVLHDGTAGLLAIKRRGGTAYVQDPHEALYPGMPRNAMELVKPDLIADARALGRALAKLAADPPDPPRALTCPECNGAVWETVTEGLPRYRCRAGHEFGSDAFDVEQAERVEAALWTRLHALEQEREGAA